MRGVGEGDNLVGATVAPGDEERGQEVVAVGEVPVERAFGHSKLRCERFDAHGIDAVSREASERGGDPVGAVE